MIIFEKIGLANLRIQEEAESAQDAELITEQELKNVKENYPTGFYTTNLIIRAGFFILTLLGSLCIGLLFSLVISVTKIVEHPVWPIFLGLCSYIALEVFVTRNRLFRSGIDDALIWLSAALLTGGFVWAMLGNYNQYLFISCFILLLSFYLTLRFANTIMSMISCLSLYALVFFIWIKMGTIGEATMPFLIMVVSFFTYYMTTRIRKDGRVVNYQKCLISIQVVSLLFLYLAGNYFVVQTLSEQLHQSSPGQNSPLPFGWFFWIWTMVLPLVYIGLGLKDRRLLLLRVGFVVAIAAGYTFRNYYHLMPMEYVLVILGAVLILATWGLIKYLKAPKFGFTYKQRNSRHWASNVNLESLVVAGAASSTPSIPADGSRFGGGSFGGGGSSSEF
jgi:uncharacterized membrane protein YgcG